MNNKTSNENGITLIELLGAIVIMGIISALTFPILIGGMKTAKDIQNETILRDEADYLMAALVKELYTTKESDIKSKELPEKNTSNYYIIFQNGKKTGFIDNRLILSDKKISLDNPDVHLMPSQLNYFDEEKNDGRYEVTLNLKLKRRSPVNMEFKNVLDTIHDIEDGKEEGL